MVYDVFTFMHFPSYAWRFLMLLSALSRYFLLYMSVGLFKNKSLLTKLVGATPIRLTESSTEDFQVRCRQSFSVTDVGRFGDRLQDLHTKKKWNQPLYTYIYFTWSSDSHLLPGFFFFFFVLIETSTTWFWRRRTCAKIYIISYHILYIIAEAQRMLIPTIKEVMTHMITAYLKFRHIINILLKAEA